MLPAAAAARSRRNPSTIGNWLHAILRALEARGLDGRAVALTAGVSERALGSPNERVPQPAMTALWRQAIAATGDPAFPLDVPRHVTVTTFGALTYACLASPDLATAFRRIVRFHGLVSDAVEMRFTTTGDFCELTLEPASPAGPPIEAIDAFAALLVRFARGLTSGPRRIEPCRIRLRRTAPERSEIYRRVFRAPVDFEAHANALVYARGDCEMRLPDANLELARQNEQVIAGMLDQLGSHTLAERTRLLIVELLPEPPNETVAARRLGMSRSSLHVALRSEGSSYREILNQTREELAREYLAAGSYPIKEIAFLLGFADASTFTRAFKRWTGETPFAYAAAQPLRPTSSSGS